MGPVDDLHPGDPKLVTPINQQPQRDRLVINFHHAQPLAAQADERDGVRVDRVGSATLPGREHASSCGQFRRNVEHLLAIGDKPLRDMPPDPVAPLHSPHPVAVLPAGGEHRLVTVLVRRVPAAAEDPLPVVGDLDRC